MFKSLISAAPIFRMPSATVCLSLLAASLVACAPANTKDAAAAAAAATSATALAVPAAGASAAAGSDAAQAIRTALAQRFDKLPPIDSVEPAPVPGLWEVRLGHDIVYTDAGGNYLIQGEIIETESRRNLTQERVAKLSTIDFASLPLQDAVVWRNGTGARKIAVFADPNCGYCKRFEQGLKEVKDVTVYTFLYPILGGDSPQKSEAVWCAKDRAAAWNQWMRDGTAIPRSLGPCETPIQRNLELGRKHRVNGTPAIVFEDGSRVPGAIEPAAIESHFQRLAKKS